jgi:hypothetical protein
VAPIGNRNDTGGRGKISRQKKYLAVTSAPRGNGRASHKTEPKNRWITIGRRRDIGSPGRRNGSRHKDGQDRHGRIAARETSGCMDQSRHHSLQLE